MDLYFTGAAGRPGQRLPVTSSEAVALLLSKTGKRRRAWDPARARYFPGRSWQTWLGAIEAEGLIVRSGPGWT